MPAPPVLAGSTPVRDNGRSAFGNPLCPHERGPLRVRLLGNGMLAIEV